MKRPSFANQPDPLIVSVIKEHTRLEAIAAIRDSYFDGAHGYDLHVSFLDPEYRTVEHMKSIIAAAGSQPVLALNYNVGFEGYVPVSDEERAEKLLLAVEAGAACIDMQGCLFDEASRSGLSDPQNLIDKNLPFVAVNPKEITFDPVAVEKQKELIKKVHDMGAEVLMSVHTGVVMTAEQILSMAKEMEKRGIDILKVVTPSRGLEDNIECLKANMLMQRELKIKTHHHCNGAYGKMTRLIAPMFGAHLIFTNQSYTPVSDMTQPLLRTTVDIYRHAEWRLPEED